jgi:uncharacterized membrane protein
VHPSHVVLLAFLIGVIAGLRSLTAPAVVAWSAHRGWMPLHDTPLSFMASRPAVVIFILVALVELVADKLPLTPSRLAPAGLGARVTFGALSGAAVAAAGAQSIVLGAVLGGAGGVAGAFAGYHARTGLVKALQVPDWVVAICEDAVAIGGGLLIVSRF